MSKTTETLKKASFKEDVLRNHIADTYFSQKIHPKVRKKRNVGSVSLTIKLPVFKLPVIKTEVLLKAGIAACLTFATLAGSLIITSYLNEKHITYLKRKVATLKTIPVLNKGVVNRELIKRLEFRGYAKNDTSRITREGAVFSNPEKYKWADLSVDFRVPIDVSSKYLLLSIKGDVGGERINIVFRDINNRSSRMSDIFASSNWSDKAISLDRLKGDIDLTGINQIRIESGYVGDSVKENDPRVGFKIYVRGITISKEM